MAFRDKPHPSWVMLALVTIQVLFGINYIVSKVIVDTFPPLVWAAGRMMITAVIMTWIARMLGRKHPAVGMRFFGPMIVFALLGIVINQGAFLLGLHYSTSSNSAILNTLTPIFTLMIVTLRGQEKMNQRKLWGFLFAFAGVLILRKVEEFSFSNRTFLGDSLLIVNCLSFSCFIAFSKKFMEEHDQFWTTAWLFIFGSIGLVLIALPEMPAFVWPRMTANLWGCVAFAIIGATLMPYFLNNWTLKYAKSSHVALFIYIQPVVAITLAWLLFREKITLRAGSSCLMIFIGVLIALSPRSGAVNSEAASSLP